jgi:ribosome-binding factor A
MSTFRKERMSEAIRKVVCEKIARYHSLIPQGLVTINRVDVTPDYQVAKIFYSVFGANLNEKEAEAVMKSHQPEFRYEISQKLKLRRTPRIEFCFDKNTEYAFKIDSLLKKDLDLG